jgi:hypothetical protein
MTGPLPTKKELKNAKVYIHYPDEYAKTIHIDIEHPDINKIIKPKETTYVAGKEGGCFIGLKKEMQDRVRKSEK